jgi:DNA-binding CsgD family transcriptional regulator
LGGLNVIGSGSSGSRPGAGFSDLIVDAIGSDDFGRVLLRHLHSLFNIDGCVLYSLSGGALCLVEITGNCRVGADPAQVSRYLSRAWRADPSLRPMMSDRGQELSLSRICIDDLDVPLIRDEFFRPCRVRERIVLARREAESTIILSLTASDLAPENVALLCDSAATLMCLASKHIQISRARAAARPVLTSLREIELFLAELDGPLSQREMEVCARCLFGMTSAGAALDLGIGVETVVTHRKRAYAKLGISTERELTLWYRNPNCAGNPPRRKTIMRKSPRN